jgi:hypothetical protein
MRRWAANAARWMTTRAPLAAGTLLACTTGISNPNVAAPDSGTSNPGSSCPPVPFQTPHVTFLASPVTGKEWGVQLYSVGGRPPYTWVVSGGTLPTGWVVNPNGDWFGTSTASGAFSFTLTGSDANGTTSGGPVTGTLVVSGPSPFAIGAFTLPTFGVGEDLGFEPPIEGGTPPYAFTVTGLPPGVTYDPATGTLMGRPTATGMFPVSFALRDSLGNVPSNSPQTATLNVSSCQSTGGPPPSGCTSPAAQLTITVSAERCMMCHRFVIVAQSTQIQDAISAGQNPCTQGDQAGGPTGCMMETVFAQSYFDCSAQTACGPYMVDLGQEFLPASSGVAPTITDAVTFCAYDYDGATFTQVGACVTPANLCDPTTTVTMLLN